jgi:hypothetical protein
VDREIVKWRLENFERMGFEYMQALWLVNLRDHRGVTVHHTTVQKLVDEHGLQGAYALLDATFG